MTNCHGLKLRAADGKMRMTDVATAEQMFHVIQSIPSPKAEPFKMWIERKTGCKVISPLNASDAGALDVESDEMLPPPTKNK